MMKIFLCLSLSLAITFAAIDDCLYDVWGSESDAQVTGYRYCTQNPLAKITTDTAKITVRLNGRVNTCNPLEPNLSDQQLKDQLGLDTRPYFKGTLRQDASGKWLLRLAQYGDANCANAQRASDLNWGEGHCKQGIVSLGYVHEIYFVDEDCEGFEALDDVTRFGIAKGDFQKGADGVEPLPEKLIDPYPVLSVATNRTYLVKNKVLSKAYTSAPDGAATYCYGIGQKHQPPVHQANLNLTSGFYSNKIFFPFDGLACGVSCANDIISANVAAGGNPLQVPVFFANTTCGQAYGLMRGYNTTANPSTGGLTAAAYSFSSLILHYAAPKQCNKCTNDLSTDVLAVLLSRSNATVPKSRFILCQTDVFATNFIFQDTPNVPADPNNCVAGGTASTPSASAAAVASPSVASSEDDGDDEDDEDDEDSTSSSTSFSFVSVIFVVLGYFISF